MLDTLQKIIILNYSSLLVVVLVDLLVVKLLLVEEVEQVDCFTIQKYQ